MRIFVIIVSFLSLTAIMAYHDELLADTLFECGFIQEKLSNGKSNEVSCSMDPDKVFSTIQHQHNQNEYCEVAEAYHYNDYIDFYVTEKTVSWKSKYGLSERAKPGQKKYYIQKGKSEEEAEKSVNWFDVTNHFFSVFSHYIGQKNIYFNSLTRQPYKEPIKEKVHVYTFGDGNHSFSLYIPEISKKAILIEYSSLVDSSWVNIRFGTCREVSRK